MKKDRDLSTLARGVLVSFSLGLLKFLEGGYYPIWNFIGLFVITYSDSRRATFLKHQVIMTFKKIVKFECYTGITSSQSLSMALTLFYRFH